MKPRHSGVFINVGFMTLEETAYSGKRNITWSRGTCYPPGDISKTNVPALLGYPASMHWDNEFAMLSIGSSNPPNASSLVFDSHITTITDDGKLVSSDGKYIYRAGKEMRRVEEGCPPGMEPFGDEPLIIEWEVIRIPK